MHITFILPDLNAGGAQKMIVNLANWFAQHQCKVDLVLINKAGIYRGLVSSQVRIIDFHCSRTMFSVFKIRKYLKTQKPDIVLSALFYVNIVVLIGKFLANATETKIIISERIHVTTSMRSLSVIKRALWLFVIKHIYPFSHRIIGISNGVCEDLKNILSRKSWNKVLTIYNPVITENEQKQLAVKVPDVFPTNSTHKIITSGRLDLQKDYPTLITAFSEYLKQEPKAYLVVLGSGSLEQELKDLCLTLDISNSVSFLGFVESPIAYMKQADTFLITSAWEGFCNVIVEALFCGLNVVTTDCPSGPAEILQQEKYGTLCQIGDYKHIDIALRNVNKHSLNSNHQKQRALDFHINNIGNQFLELFQDVINEK